MPRTEEQFSEMREKTKQKILENALLLFAEKGFKGTSINDIAKSAGISKGLAYNYFKSKYDLMISVLKLIEEEFSRLLIALNNENDPYKKLTLMITLTIEMLQRDEKFWSLYMNFAFQSEVKEEAQNLMGDSLKILFNLIEKIFVEVGVKNPVEESKILGAILDGISFHYIIEKEKYPIEKVKTYLLKKYSKSELSKSILQK